MLGVDLPECLRHQGVDGLADQLVAVIAEQHLSLTIDKTVHALPDVFLPGTDGALAAVMNFQHRGGLVVLSTVRGPPVSGTFTVHRSGYRPGWREMVESSGGSSSLVGLP
jgi:hypothetical protein